MSVQVEKLEKSMAKLTVETSAEELEAAIQKAYLRDKNKISIPGFRKGKAPRKMIEKMYGASVFYEAAANLLIPDAYAKAVSESGEPVVAQPKITVTQIEAGKPFIFVAEVALRPEVTLGQYKGVEIEKTETAVTDAEVDAKVAEEREKNSRMLDVDDRAVEKGDQIKLDFEGFVDGTAFAGGKGEDYPLTIGSGSFIPGFEDQLIGAEIGKETEVNVTFPENYQAEELKGKAAVFKCTVKSIQVKELPEADDEFAQEVSEFDTLEEYKEDLRRELLEKKQENAKRTKQNRAVAKAVENAAMDVPEPMIREQMRVLAEEFGRRIQSQGISIEQYMQFTGVSRQQLVEQMRPEAVKRIKNSLVLEEIAKAEQIEIKEERIEEELAKMAEHYKVDVENIRRNMGDEGLAQMKSDLTLQAAVELVADAAVETEPKAPEEKPETAEEAPKTEAPEEKPEAEAAETETAETETAAPAEKGTEE